MPTRGLLGAQPASPPVVAAASPPVSVTAMPMPKPPCPAAPAPAVYDDAIMRMALAWYYLAHRSPF